MDYARNYMLDFIANLNKKKKKKTEQFPEHARHQKDSRQEDHGRGHVTMPNSTDTVKSIWRVSNTKSELLQEPAAGRGGARL